MRSPPTAASTPTPRVVTSRVLGRIRATASLRPPGRGRDERLIHVRRSRVPEILEVETARALLDARALDREIAKVHAPDAWFLKRGLTPPAVRAALKGQSFVAARRRGKLILVDLSSRRGARPAPRHERSGAGRRRGGG